MIVFALALLLKIIGFFFVIGIANIVIQAIIAAVCLPVYASQTLYQKGKDLVVHHIQNHS